MLLDKACPTRSALPPQARKEAASAILRADGLSYDVWVQAGQAGPEDQLSEVMGSAADRIRFASRETAWQLVYVSATVRPDWLLDVSKALNTRVGLLSATIEQVDGTSVGRLVVSIDSSLGEAAVRDALSRSGLSGDPVDARIRERSAA